MGGIKISRGEEYLLEFQIFFLNELSDSKLSIMKICENVPIAQFFVSFQIVCFDLTCLRPIIVNFSFIVGRLHCKNIDENAVWKLTNWLIMRKKVTSLFCKKNV